MKLKTNDDIKEFFKENSTSKNNVLIFISETSCSLFYTSFSRAITINDILI